jgi:hypothetical protein
MSDEQNPNSIDLIRWTFSVNPAHKAAIEEHLSDLGVDVLVREDSHFLVSWDEPEGSLDEVIEHLWALNEEPFDITQEEFHCQNVFHVHHDDSQAEDEGESAAA